MSLFPKKRIFYILIVFTMIMIMFSVRIIWIQFRAAFKEVTPSGKTMNEMAVRQRIEGIELDSGRGHFVDRNGQMLTGEVIWVPVLFPVRQLPHKTQLHDLAQLLHTTSDQLEQKWSNLEFPYVWTQLNGSEEVPLQLHQAESKELSHTEGFEILPYVSRYKGENSGHQWLGYVSQRPDVIRKVQAVSSDYRFMPLSLLVGASGLERTFDDFLRGSGFTTAALLVDAQKRPLNGLGTRVITSQNSFYPLQIRTTVDIELQQKLEVIAKDAGRVEGAIVVLDAQNADVVAMVSSPFYNERDINVQEGNWSNLAVKAAVPGSIFKTVIAAAALEEGLTHRHEMFHCSGHYNKYGLSCWKEGGHGDITLEQGFAQSCNVVFATLGERLSPSTITATAAKLGLGQKVGWHSDSFLDMGGFNQIDQEEGGTIFGKETGINGGVLAQTALGQRNVMMSPLQGANLIVTLLHAGQLIHPRLVSEVNYKDRSSLVQFPVQNVGSKNGQISPNTASLLLSWMRGVVTEGTGSSLQRAKWHLAGKSGTAEITKDGKNRNNQWFIGYGPTESPKYAVAVFVGDRPTNSPHQATAIFRRTMDILASH